ncbi:MAG: hypothetical protein ACE14P_12280 [Methanotrichaceae archaeon]
MDVSFSAWRQIREESLVLKLESFAFLFDRRYTNRLNRMSRVFFEAYAKATKELATQEDRFPSLSEIDAKMESGAVYAFKDRLMKNTEFFEEVKISGVSYLVPHASRFIDVSGTYTDLAFDFDAGTVMLPTRRKMPATVEIKPPKEDAAAEDVQPEAPPSSEPAIKSEFGAPEIESYPEHVPEPYTEAEEIAEIPNATNEVKQEPVPPTTAAPNVHSPEGTAQTLFTKGSRNMPTIAIALLVAVILTAAGGYFLMTSSPQGTPSIVKYSAFLSNASNETYLEMDITNQDNIMNELDMMLPPDIDKSISSQGGIVTISHSSSTIVRLNSSQDASIRIYLLDNWTSVPVNLSLGVPAGFDSSLEVHGKDYNVKRKDSSLILKFNCTREGINFDQSYLRKR